MILKASQRGGAAALSAHLLNANDNEHVELHDLRGFLSENLMGAMKEAQAVALGTKCKQFLFSVSLSPPENERVPIDVFEKAIERVEEATGLKGQPRMVIFHEKEGRRHAHAVWSRIDAETMKAIPLPFFKMKLREVSRGLYFEQGWKMPAGLMNSEARDPTNFTLAEWQAAKRAGHSAKALKETVQECWAVSDSRASFAKALEERGLYLARGDRRSHVAVTYEGEVFAVSRLTGQRTKDVRARLGDAADLRSVEETKAHIAETVRPRLKSFIDEARTHNARENARLTERRQALHIQHHTERAKLDEGQAQRRTIEAKDRSARLRKGALGLWDRVTGKRAQVVRQMEIEAYEGVKRDRAQRDRLVADQLQERRELQLHIRYERHRHAQRLLELHRDIQRHSPERREETRTLRETFQEASAGRQGHDEGRQDRAHGREDRGRGLELDR